MPDGAKYRIEEIARKLVLVSGKLNSIIERRKSVPAYEALQIIAGIMEEDLHRLRQEIENEKA